MLIEDYFQEIQDLIDQFCWVLSCDIDCDKRGLYEGFIRGQIKLTDHSLLHLREFIYVETRIDRKMYSYQYMSPAKAIIFRYDNTDHHRQLNLANFPHHKHDGSEDNVVSSSAPTIADVLKEIATLLMSDGC